MCPFKRANLACLKCLQCEGSQNKDTYLSLVTSVIFKNVRLFLQYFSKEMYHHQQPEHAKKQSLNSNNRNNPISSVYVDHCVVHCVLLLSIIRIFSLSYQTRPLIMCLSPLVHSVFITLQAPESLLESLETHLNTLEGKKPWVVQYICHLFRFLSWAAATVSWGFNNPVIIQFHGFPAMPKAIEVHSDFGSG